MSASAISCVAPNKSYPKHTVFSDLELVVPGHGICALLGKNGAGKTTLIRLALGLARPTAGHIELLSSPPGAANNRIGYLSENLAIYPHLGFWKPDGYPNTLVGQMQHLVTAGNNPTVLSTEVLE